MTVAPVPVVPMTMKPAVWPDMVSVSDEGTMASDAIGSGDPAMLTVSVAVPVTAVPSGLVATAVMAVAPLVRAVATPVAELMLATDGTLEVQTAALMIDVPTVADSSVRFTVVPDPVVPITMKPAVWLAEVSVCAAGTMASDTIGSLEEVVGVTARVAVPVTTVPSGFVAIAVIVVVPGPTDVATPVAALIVPTAGTEEVQTAALIVAVPTFAV